MPPLAEARAAQTAPPELRDLREAAPLAVLPRPDDRPSFGAASIAGSLEDAFTTSTDIGLLVAGLVAAQLAFPKIGRSQTATVRSKREGAASYTYDYADLADVLNAVRPVLAANGIAVVQAPVARPRVVFVVTLLAHTSGQFIRNVIPVAIESPDPQALGSAITYLRRYALQSLLGVAPEDDDDGAAASRQPTRPGQGPVQMPQRQPAPVPPVGAAAGPASHSPAVVATATASDPVPELLMITALEKRTAASGAPYWVVAFSDGLKGCTFSTSIGQALEIAQKKRTVYREIMSHTKGSYTYIDELVPQHAGGAQ